MRPWALEKIVKIPIKHLNFKGREWWENCWLLSKQAAGKRVREQNTDPATCGYAKTGCYWRRHITWHVQTKGELCSSFLAPQWLVKELNPWRRVFHYMKLFGTILWFQRNHTMVSYNSLCDSIFMVTHRHVHVYYSPNSSDFQLHWAIAFSIVMWTINLLPS